MPRMSKKRKEEWAFFLNERNRITYNPLCRKCRRTCKQSFRAKLSFLRPCYAIGAFSGCFSRLLTWGK